jgi:hypothetical protein
MKPSPTRIGLQFTTVLVLAGLAGAQVPLGGPIYNGSGGPLVSGTVYHATGIPSVPLGETLTIQAGAIVKFTAPASYFFAVQGTLVVNGTSLNPVIFTSLADDSAGGDTNADGPSTGFPGDWGGLDLYDTASGSSINSLEVRYSGFGGQAGVMLYTNSATLANCTIRDGQDRGMHLVLTAYPTVSNCSFLNNAAEAVTGVRLDAVSGFSNNTATANGGNYIRTSEGTLAFSATVPSDAIVGAAIVVNEVDVPVGMTLTLEGGVVIKPLLPTTPVKFGGALDANGSAGSPVVFTSFADDSVGGDTNGDGPSSGTPGDWSGLRFLATSDASTLDYCHVRYGGAAPTGLANVELWQADISLTGCELQDGATDGLDLNANSRPTVLGCVFEDNLDLAVDGAELDAVPNFSSNSASGNGGDYLHVSEGNMDADVTLTVDNLIGDALVVDKIEVAATETLTIGQGVVIKPESVNEEVEVLGTLDVNGVEGNPVVFTALADDSAGGDTNGDGPSVGLPGDGLGLDFHDTSDASTLDWCEVRFGGGLGGAYLNSADIAVNNCLLRDASGDGMRLQNNAKPTVRDTAFDDNTGYAVNNAYYAAIPGFSQNTASGNGAGDFLHVLITSLDADATIEEHNIIGDAIVAGGCFVTDGLTLTLGQGVVIKTDGTNVFDVYGTLNCEGTESHPVVITSIHDDSIAGDTNGNGSATLPAPGDWRGIRLTNTEDGSTLRNVLLRYPGTDGWSGLWSYSTVASLEGVRVDHSAGIGINLDDLASATRLCAWKSAADGVRLGAGLGFDLSHVSSISNAGIGIFKDPGHAGSVKNSIAWNNTGANYSGFTTGDLTYSDGDAALSGFDGNINIDPLFADEPNGDIGLTAPSPCVDTGDPFSEMDPDCTPADMGCEYYNSGDGPFTYCTPKTNSQGCLPYVDFEGYASVSDAEPFWISCNDVLNNKVGRMFYGISGPHSAPFKGGTKCVLSPVKRMPIQNAGGDPPPDNCSGTYLYDFNDRIQTFGDPWLIVGNTVNAQFWMRDPTSSFTIGLSDGIQFGICP